MDRTPHAIGVDVGGTKTLVGLVSGGLLLDRREQPTRVGGDDLERIGEFVTAALVDWAGLQPVTIGAGFPEYVDSNGLLTSREVLTWARQPREVLRDATTAAGLPQLPIVIESDVRAAAMGEAVHGRGADVDSFLYVSLGTGLSSTLVIDGNPWRGARGEAIALGEWTPLSDAGEAGPGNLEQFCSGTGLTERYRACGSRADQARDVVAAAAAGDDRAQEILRTAGSALGRACAELVQVLDPARVIVGGGLGQASTALFDTVQATYRSLVSSRPDSPDLVQAETAASGVVGAAVAGLTAATS